MKVMAVYEKITEIAKSPKDKQGDIRVSEVYNLYRVLSMRYDVLETSNILKNCVQGKDLLVVMQLGIRMLNKQIEMLEKLVQDYGIPAPVRPPADAKSIGQIEAITDRYIFRRVFRGIQSFIPVEATAFAQATSAKLRETFKKMLIEELDTYDKFIEYGKIKGFEYIPPAYRS